VGGLSVVSLLMRSPFTYRIERNHVPKRVLEDSALHGAFYRAHVVATSSWAASQSLAAAVGAVLIHAKLDPGAALVQAVGTLTPVGITRYRHEGFMATLRETDPEPEPHSEREREPDAGDGAQREDRALKSEAE
jgi:hypothetical protein